MADFLLPYSVTIEQTLHRSCSKLSSDRVTGIEHLKADVFVEQTGN